MNYKRDILEFEKFLKAESLVVEQFKYMDARNYLNGLYEKKLKKTTVSRKISSLRSFYNYLLDRSEEHTSELQSRGHLVCRLLLEKKKKKKHTNAIVMKQ